jgi:hypothetical protein
MSIDLIQISANGNRGSTQNVIASCTERAHQ